MATGRYIIAIDVGIKNLGLCIFDFHTSKVCVWENVSLVPNGRYQPMNNVEYVFGLVERFGEYFKLAGRVVIERQMRCNMRIIESVLQALFYEKCTIISARSVKAHYDLSTRNYRTNKVVAVEWVTEFTESNSAAFEPAALSKFKAKKKDDLADSLLLVLYYLDTYSNHLTSLGDGILQGGLVL